MSVKTGERCEVMVRGKLLTGTVQAYRGGACIVLLDEKLEDSRDWTMSLSPASVQPERKAPDA